MSERLVTPSGSAPENLFIELFSDAFGAEKAAFLYPQYHFTDIYQNDRYADFFLENGGKRIAIEIDDEASHNPSQNPVITAFSHYNKQKNIWANFYVITIINALMLNVALDT